MYKSADFFDILANWVLDFEKSKKRNSDHHTKEVKMEYHQKQIIKSAKLMKLALEFLLKDGALKSDEACEYLSTINEHNTKIKQHFYRMPIIDTSE